VARTIPSLAQQVPGNYNTSALENSIRYAIGYFAAVPVFYGYQSATQSVLDSTFTAITIDTEQLDPDGGHSNTVNPSRYTPQVPGTYLVFGTTAWNTSGVGYRRSRIQLNGSNVKSAAASTANNQVVTAAVTATGIVTCNGSTDYIEVWGAQDSGGALSTLSATDFTSSLIVLWMTT
jgi:hypothetical protein